MNRLLACSLALVLTPSAGLAAASAAMRVALVFDDGPDPQQTPRVLRALADAEVRATFPYLGRQVEAHPQLARAAAAAGHEIANHSFSHPHLRQLPDAEVKAEISRTSLAIQWATGRPPAWFWSPYLETDARIDRLARGAAGAGHFPLQKVRLISTEDWDTARTDAAAILHRATTGVEDLTIILFHEWRAETADQLPVILAELRRQGCEFLTLTELSTALAAVSAP